MWRWRACFPLIYMGLFIYKELNEIEKITYFCISLLFVVE